MRDERFHHSNDAPAHITMTLALPKTGLHPATGQGAERGDYWGALGSVSRERAWKRAWLRAASKARLRR
jgi:hypothetical protein